MSREERNVAAACRTVATLVEIVGTLPVPPGKRNPTPLDRITKNTLANDVAAVARLQEIGGTLARFADSLNENFDKDLPPSPEAADDATRLIAEAGRLAGELLRHRRRRVAGVAA